MSAYLCNSEHIGALAAFAVNKSAALYEWREGINTVDNARTVAKYLAGANIASVSKRYPNDEEGGRPGQIANTSDQKYIDDCQAWAEQYVFQAPVLSPLSIYSMTLCFEYQACEVDEWADSLAFRQIRWIQNAAVRMLPGFEESVRDFSTDEPVPTPGSGPVLLSAMFTC